MLMTFGRAPHQLPACGVHLGKMFCVEQGLSAKLFARPTPYSVALLFRAAAQPAYRERRQYPPGEIPSPTNPGLVSTSWPLPAG